MFTVSNRLFINNQTASEAVSLAVNDLVRDLKKICGCEVESSASSAGINICLDNNISGSEQYCIIISGNGVTISGSDELGVIYGIYRFSRESLGVDPMWFWKDSYPDFRGAIALDDQTIVSKPATFKYRGWFINDEDLLTEWKDSSGQRFIDYPYYNQVISLEIAEAVYESALRLGVNLMIPASFVDVMNPPEAELIVRAAARGFYVTQHHIEPLGVSHFGFENYWKSQGQTAEFSYGIEPEKVIEVWRAYAAKWYELAGDRVIWQLGLRGKGDRAIWDSDSSISEEEAGSFISRALKQQVAIVKEIDPRSNPPFSTTLWMEMSNLMAAKKLELPDQLITVFSDYGPTQEMGDDFYSTPRESSLYYGAYFHIAFWIRGAHLVGGVSPAKVERVFREIICKGDTEYAIINVSNIREHVIGIEATMGMMNHAGSWRLQDFMENFAGKYKNSYDRFFNAYISTPAGDIQDGNVIRIIWLLTEYLKGKYTEWPALLRNEIGIYDERSRNAFVRYVRLQADGLDSIADGIGEDATAYHRFALCYQSRLLAEIYRTVAAIFEMPDKSAPLDDVIRSAEQVIKLYPEAEYGKWKNWYRGEKKANWSSWISSLKELNSIGSQS